MRKESDYEEDNYVDLKKLKRASANEETKRNKNMFDELMSFNNANRQYMGISKKA